MALYRNFINLTPDTYLDICHDICQDMCLVLIKIIGGKKMKNQSNHSFSQGEKLWKTV